MNFVALDLETANSDITSICQLGLAFYENGLLTKQWASYIDPQKPFADFNIAIHGIGEAKIKGQPNFRQVMNAIRPDLLGKVLVSHTSFDRVALAKALERHGLEPLACHWLDSAWVARRTWSAFRRRGYGLKNICQMLGYEFTHHDALEDAKAAAQIMLAAQRVSGLNITGWLCLKEQSRVRK